MGTRMLVFLAIIWALGSGVQAGELTRAEKEAFLKKGRVVSVKDVGIGATKPLKVVLEHNGQQMKAIFKSVDLWMDAETSFSGEKAGQYIDSYRSELAAYELDKLLGMDILPAVVMRRIKGKKGSLREWIDDVMPRYGHGQLPPDPGLSQDRIQMMWLFDYLIYNVDRRVHNLMIGSQWRPIYIDHSMAFGTFQKMYRPIYRFPRELVATLRDTDPKVFEKQLKPYLRKVQIEAFLHRRERILALVDQRLAEADTNEVFYSLADIR